MKYYYQDGKWIQERRNSWFKKNSNTQIDNNKRLSDTKEILKNDFNIANAFALLGINFQVINLGESIIINHYNILRNLKEIQSYSDEIKKSFYLAVFEDESFIVCKGNQINLFYSENDVDIALNSHNLFLKSIGSNVSIKKILIEYED